MYICITYIYICYGETWLFIGRQNVTITMFKEIYLSFELLLVLCDVTE